MKITSRFNIILVSTSMLSLASIDAYTMKCSNSIYSLDELIVTRRPEIPENIFSDFEDVTIERREIIIRCRITNNGEFSRCKILPTSNMTDVVRKNLIKYAESFTVARTDRGGEKVAGKCVQFKHVFVYGE